MCLNRVHVISIVRFFLVRLGLWWFGVNCICYLVHFWTVHEYFVCCSFVLHVDWNCQFVFRDVIDLAGLWTLHVLLISFMPWHNSICMIRNKVGCFLSFREVTCCLRISCFIVMLCWWCFPSQGVFGKSSNIFEFSFRLNSSFWHPPAKLEYCVRLTINSVTIWW